MAYPQITTDVELLMDRIQNRIDAQPHFRAILDAIQDCRCYANGICESSGFSEDLISSTKSFVYKCLMRVFKTNFERQRLFNHSLVDTLELLAEELDKIQQRLPANDDASIGSR